MTEPNNSSAVVMPAYFNPCFLLEDILRSWGAENMQALSRLEAPQADLPVERSVKLNGILEGLLDIRTSPEFLFWLQKRKSTEFKDPFPGEQIMDEMTRFLCLHLFHHFWVSGKFHIGPIQPIASNPKAWPTRPPDSACALLVESHKVEVRIWLKNNLGVI